MDSEEACSQILSEQNKIQFPQSQIRGQNSDTMSTQKSSKLIIQNTENNIVSEQKVEESIGIQPVVESQSQKTSQKSTCFNNSNQQSQSQHQEGEEDESDGTGILIMNLDTNNNTFQKKRVTSHNQKKVNINQNLEIIRVPQNKNSTYKINNRYIQKMAQQSDSINSGNQSSYKNSSSLDTQKKQYGVIQKDQPQNDANEIQIQLQRPVSNSINQIQTRNAKKNSQKNSKKGNKSKNKCTCQIF